MKTINLNQQVETLQKMMKTTTSILNLCTYKESKILIIEGLLNEIHQCVNCIDQLKEEVKQGNITLEMAKIEIDRWMNEDNWEDAKELYDALANPEESLECQKLRDAMELLQKSLGELNHSLLDAPEESYQHFYELCREKEGTRTAQSNFKKFKCKCMYKDDLLRSMLYYQQKIFYIFYEKDILRFDDCPLQDPHSRKFKFDFELLSNEAVETPATIKFCRCMNYYLIIPDKYTIHLNTEKLGKYIFEYYLELKKDYFFAIAYLEEALELYNQKMKDDGFLDDEPKDDAEINILMQPAAMVLWEKLQRAGYINQDLKPTRKLSNPQLAIIADEFCAKMDMKTKWTTFEKLWNKKNIRGYNSRALNQESSYPFREVIRQLFS